MKRIIFPLIITGVVGFFAVSCGSGAQEQKEDSTAASMEIKDSTGQSGFTPNTMVDGKEADTKQLKAENTRTVSMDGKDLEVTTMYAGSTPKQVYCKTIGREDEARYYFNSEGKVSMLDEIRKGLSGDYVQEIFIYVGDSLQVAVKRQAPSKSELEKAKADNFTPDSKDYRADAKKVSQRGFVLLVSQE